VTGPTPVRLAWLDALRGYAALVVVVFHLSPTVLGSDRHLALYRHFDLGKYGVLLFFLVSGYVIPMSLERHGSLRRFWIGRLCRIYPAYLAAIATQGFRIMFEERIRALRDLHDPRERLLSVMLAHLRFSVADAALYRVMFGAEVPAKAQFPELEQAATRSYGILETCVGDYLSHRNADLKLVRSAALAAWTACHGLATVMADRLNAWDIVGKDDPLKIGHHVFSIFIAGLDHQP